MGKIRSKYFLIFLIAIMGIFLLCGTVAANGTDSNSESTTSSNHGINSVSSDDSNSNISNDTTNTTESRPKKLSQSKIISAAKKVNTYASKNNKLPNYITISDYKYSMPEFLYLMSKTIYNKQNKIKSDVSIKYDIKNPSKASGKWVKGNIYSVYYYNYAKKAINFMDKYKKAPNSVKTAGGSYLQYQSLTFLFTKVLKSTKSSKLPYYVTFDVKKNNPINKYLPTYTRDSYFVSQFPTKLLGQDERGYVQLIGVIGNTSSKTKIAYIIGLHPLEKQAHNSLYKLLSANTKLKYKYYIYKITVTNNPNSYDVGRMNGQVLAQKYVLPHAKKAKYNLVIDVHSNQGTRNGGSYQKTNFIFAPLNNAKSKSVANKLIKNIPGLSYYFPSSQTSPPYCTNPLVSSGTKTIIYETYIYESVSKTNALMKKLIAQVEKLKI